VRAQRSDRSRHIVIRLTAGESLPQALVGALREQQVSGGWLRAGGIVSDVELRAFDPARGQLGERRHLDGPLHALSIEGSVGMMDGEPACSLRAVLARETDRGLETIAGEIVSARAVALEAVVTAFDDLVLARGVDAAGIALLDGGVTTTSSTAAVPPRNAPAPARAATTSAASAWSAAASASTSAERVERDGPRPAYPAPSAGSSGQGGSAPMPQKPARPAAPAEQPIPETGDIVDHFAFGRCEVVKTDGDRLHLRIPRDGRIREIALEMLRVIPLDGEDGEGTERGVRHFKLERRI
jgi:predicted DNA-binding protein with PD1-like motif